MDESEAFARLGSWVEEADRAEIAGHVGRLGHELIRFAELARARLNALQDDFSDVPQLALQDEGSAIVMAKELPRAGSLRLPRPNRGPLATRKPYAQRVLPEPPEEAEEDATEASTEPVDTEPVAVAGPARWLPSAPSFTEELCETYDSPDRDRGVPTLPTFARWSQPEELPEPGVPKSAPRRFLPTPALCSQTEELPEPPQSPDVDSGVPKSAPSRRFLPTPALRSKEELPEPPQSPDADSGVPKSAPARRFLPTPALRSKEELPELPDPGTPEPPWSPQERSPVRCVRLFAEEAPEPPWVPPEDADEIKGTHGQGRRAASGIVEQPLPGRLLGSSPLGTSKVSWKQSRGSGGRAAALAIGRLQAQVSALQKRLAAVEAPSKPGARSRARSPDLPKDPEVESSISLSNLPEPPEAPENDEVTNCGAEGSALAGALPQSSTARSRSQSADSVDYWAELNDSVPGAPSAPKTHAAARPVSRPLLEAPVASATSATAPAVNSTRVEGARRTSNISLTSPAKEEAAVMPRRQSETSGNASSNLTVEEKQPVQQPVQQPAQQSVKQVPPVLSYWLQVDSISGLEPAQPAPSERVFEVQSYWLHRLASVVKLTSSAMPGDANSCRVRNQVKLAERGPEGAAKLVVEVVQKTPEVLYLGRVDLDVSKANALEVGTYELPPSSARIRLRICPHSAGTAVKQPMVPSGPRLSQTLPDKVSVTNGTAAGPHAGAAPPSAPAPSAAPSAPAATASASEAEAMENEEGEEEEPYEDDPVVG